MKNICLLIIVMLVSSFAFVGCDNTDSIVRIHIRANSNSVYDQSIKLEVRDCVVEYITPIIASCNNSEEVKCVLKSNLCQIEKISNDVLTEAGFEYVTNAEIRNEYFPSRSYDGDVYPADYYDALIVELGAGKGDNWWCVAYPPLCFVGENLGSSNIRYKSKLLEMISKFFGE